MIEYSSYSFECIHMCMSEMPLIKAAPGVIGAELFYSFITQITPYL